MTALRVPAKLRHHYGPFFPKGLAALQELFEKRAAEPGFDSSLLIKAANGSRHFRHPETIASDDGYLWLRILHFKILRTGNIIAGIGVIAFPQVTDGRAERSIAFYASTHAVTEDELDALCHDFRALLEKTAVPAAA
jgi:hypothetical protein